MNMDLLAWQIAYPFHSEMLWKGGAERQIQDFWDMAKRRGVPIAVVGSHRSKSIMLPVVQLVFPNGRILLRDNFHSLEMAVLWDFAPDLKYGDVYRPVGKWGEDGGWDAADGWTWYLNEIARCEGYSWKGWSPEELADPRITRVEITHENGSKYWSEKKIEEKERWNKRMTDPTWLHTQWGSGKLFTADAFGPGATFYIGYRTYLEGISELIPYQAQEIFERGQKDFTISTQWEAVEGIIDAIIAAPALNT